MPHIFLRTNLFCLSRKKAEIVTIFTIEDFVKPHKVSAHSNIFILGHITNQIQIQLGTWGVTNQDVLLLTALW